MTGERDRRLHGLARGAGGLCRLTEALAGWQGGGLKPGEVGPKLPLGQDRQVEEVGGAANVAGLKTDPGELVAVMGDLGDGEGDGTANRFVTKGGLALRRDELIDEELIEGSLRAEGRAQAPARLLRLFAAEIGRG